MPESRPEGEWIALFRNGDRRALENIHGLHYKTLRSFAVSFIKDQQLAEEIVEDAFIKLFRFRLQFDSLTNIRAFLYISVRHACLNAIRYNKRISRAQQEMLYLQRNDVDRQEFDDIQAHLLQQLYAEIELLPKQCREVFKLFYVNQMNTTEIARHMNLSRNTVQNHKIRAVKMLKTAFLKRKLFSVVTYAGFNKISPYLAGLAGILGFS